MAGARVRGGGDLVGAAQDTRASGAPQPQLVRELRRKFIVSAMLAVGLVVLGIVAVINIAYWLNARNTADAQLEVLASSGGSFEGMLELRQLDDANPDVSGDIRGDGIIPGRSAGTGQPATAAGQQGTAQQVDSAAGQQDAGQRDTGQRDTGQRADVAAQTDAAQKDGTQEPGATVQSDAAQQTDGAAQTNTPQPDGTVQPDATAQPDGAQQPNATGDSNAATQGADVPATTGGMPMGGREDNPFGHRRFDGTHGGMTAETPYEMRFFVVRVADGAATSVDTSRIVSVDEAQATELALRVAQAGTGSGTLDTWRYLVASEVDDAGNETLACYFLDCTRDHNRMGSLLAASAAIAAGGLLLVLVLVMLFSRHVVAPVAESYARQRRFITNASHDLKTPLAVIQSDVEVIEMLQGPDEWTGSIRNQVTRLTDLTNKLVMLSRMDEGVENVHVADFDLEAVVETVAHEFDTLAAAQGKRIRVACEPRLTAHADASLVDQLLHLLLDNALKYSSDAATIDLRAGHERNRSVIRVANPVDHMEPGEHDELFERFSRSDEARSSSGGHGIGLAVVRAIAEAHGGDAHCSCPDEHSIEFVVRL